MSAIEFCMHCLCALFQLHISSLQTIEQPKQYSVCISCFCPTRLTLLASNNLLFNNLVGICCLRLEAFLMNKSTVKFVVN